MNEQTSPSFPTHPSPSANPVTALTGSWDGTGAGDHDQAFAGFRAYQFSTRELARLLLLRGEVLEARLGQGRLVGDLAACP